MQSDPSNSTAKHSSRACENCSRAKAKCILQPDRQSDQCSRCFRLKKECVIRPRAPRKKRAPNAALNSALEQKIESLVSLLSAAQGASPQTPQDRPHLNLLRDFPWTSKNDSNVHNTESPESFSSNSPGKTNVAPTPESPSVITLMHKHFTQEISGQHSCVEGAPSSNLEPDVISDESLLSLFREKYAVHCPCAIVLPDISAQELRARNPWVYKIVMVVASSNNRNQQIETGKKLAIDISTAMIVSGEKTLDMLQCLLIFNSWSYYFSSVSPQSQSTAMLQLTLALLYDLGLHRAIREDEGGPGELLADSSKRAWAGESNMGERKRTLAERRALLYCYLVSSVISSCIKKTEGLPSSPYIEYSCEILQAAPEYETDLILVACVRLQSITESFNRNTANRPSSADNRRAPLWMHATSVRTELQSVLNALPLNLQNHPLFRMTYHSAEIFLYESSLYVLSIPSTLTSQRIDMLYACLLSSKSLLDIFIAQPLSSYLGLSITNLAELGHACSTLFKLSLVDQVGWDLTHVRQTVNLAAYFDQLITNFEEAGATIDRVQRSPSKESFPSGCSRAMGRVKGWYEAKLALDLESQGQENPTTFSGADDMMNWNGFDYLDDSYWQEIMADMSFMQQ